MITVKNTDKGLKALVCTSDSIKGDTMNEPHLIELCEGGDCQ